MTKVYELHVGEPDPLGPLYKCAMPESFDDVELQMDELVVYYDTGIAHKEGDRLLLLTLIMLSNTETPTPEDYDTIGSITSSYNKIRKDYH